MAGEKEKVHSLDRALDLLLLFQQEGKELGVTQIAALLGMQKSTVHRSLSTLEAKGFVQQNQESGRYWLGLRLYSLGMMVRDKLPLAGLLAPYAKQLAQSYREAVHLSVLDRTAEQPRHIVIDKVESSQVLSLTPPIGSSEPCHCSAGGKCLLAFSPSDYLARFEGADLQAFTQHTITNWEKLKGELAKIRQQGYSISDEELEMGLTCIAAPVFARGSEIIAALSLSGPTSRMKSESFLEMVEELKRITKQISNNLL